MCLRVGISWFVAATGSEGEHDSGHYEDVSPEFHCFHIACDLLTSTYTTHLVAVLNGRHKANARAAIRRKRSFACFIVYKAISETRLCVAASEDGVVVFAVVDESAAKTKGCIGETIECGV